MASETSTSASVNTLPVSAAAAPIRSPRLVRSSMATRASTSWRWAALRLRQPSGSWRAVSRARPASSAVARAWRPTTTRASARFGSQQSAVARSAKISAPPMTSGIRRGSPSAALLQRSRMAAAQRRLAAMDQSVSGSLTKVLRYRVETSGAKVSVVRSWMRLGRSWAVAMVRQPARNPSFRKRHSPEPTCRSGA